MQRADGANIAAAGFVHRQLSFRMPDGWNNAVHLRVANIPALLVVKAHALVGPDRPKDAYDIYYAIEQYDEGIDALGSACSELLKTKWPLLGTSASSQNSETWTTTAHKPFESS